MVMAGYYSTTAAHRTGTCQYKALNGDVVTITEVTQVHEEPVSRFPDLKFVGFVDGFVSSNVHESPMWKWLGL